MDLTARPGPLLKQTLPYAGYRNPIINLWRPSEIYNGNPYASKSVSS